PPRGYVPRFRKREAPATETGSIPQPGAIPRMGNYRLWWVIAAVLSAGIPLAAIVWIRPTTHPLPGRFEVRTQRGEIMYHMLQVASGGLQLGPQVNPNDDVTVRLTFTPENPGHRAGLVIFENNDNFVRLGRHFDNRVSLEFGAETGGVFHKTGHTYTF